MNGNYIPIHENEQDYFAFLRASDTQTVLVILNYSEKRLNLNFSDTNFLDDGKLRTLFSSGVRSKADHTTDKLTIAPFEVFIAELMV